MLDDNATPGPHDSTAATVAATVRAVPGVAKLFAPTGLIALFQNLGNNEELIHISPEGVRIRIGIAANYRPATVVEAIADAIHTHHPDLTQELTITVADILADNVNQAPKSTNMQSDSKNPHTIEITANKH